MKKLGIFLLALAIGLCGCSAPQTAPPSPEPESGSISTAEKAGPPQGVPISLNYEYDRRELWAQRDRKRIYGEIFVPKHAGEKLPAVIFSHGFGGSYQVGAPYAQGLAARGYVVYCFDFCGGSPGSRSDGSPLEMSIFTEQADLEAVIQMVKSLDYVDRENVFLMGSSQGGAVSAITAAANPEEVRGAVLLYPAFILADTAKELFPSVADIPETYYHMWMTVGRPYFEPLLDYDIFMRRFLPTGRMSSFSTEIWTALSLSPARSVHRRFILLPGWKFFPVPATVSPARIPKRLSTLRWRIWIPTERPRRYRGVRSE